MRRRQIPASATAALAAILLVGCSADGGDAASGDAGETETILLSTGTQFPPMGFIEDGELIGFEIDLGAALAEEMGVTIEWNRSEFSQFLSDVTSGRSDGVLGAILDTPERQETLSFVDYLQSGFQFYTTTAVAESEAIDDIEDLCGLTVAASRNSTYAASIEAWSAERCGGDDIEVLATDGSPDAQLQLRQGRVQAVMQTSESIAYIVANDEQFVPVGEPITTSYYGLGLPQDDTDLQDRVVEALEQLIEDGTYERIATEWDLQDQMVDRVSIDLEGR